MQIDAIVCVECFLAGGCALSLNSGVINLVVFFPPLFYRADSIHHSLLEVNQIQDQLSALRCGK